MLLSWTPVVHGNKWKQYVDDHGLAAGDTLTFFFPEKDESIFIIECTTYKGAIKDRIDQTVSLEVFNLNVEYNLQYVFYTRGTCLSNTQKENLCNQIGDSGFGAAGFFCSPAIKH